MKPDYHYFKTKYYLYRWDINSDPESSAEHYTGQGWTLSGSQMKWLRRHYAYKVLTEAETVVLILRGSRLTTKPEFIA